ATSPAVVVADENIVPVEFEVQGMTCGGCERHVSDAVTKLEGIIEVSASFENKNTIVKFDKTKTTIEEIQKAIAGTGYKVKEKINKSPQPLAPAGRQ
ncbi:MAG TPA: heavy-metal-associated domain-containing protein, partial [Phaeodactylibacter sp.]|nr:heavy-metal-associated domain-containing protein [Phaeodactylibacter sp.]